MLALADRQLTGYSYAAQAVDVFGHTFVEGIGDALAVVVGFEFLLIRGVADE